MNTRLSSHLWRGRVFFRSPFQGRRTWPPGSSRARAVVFATGPCELDRKNDNSRSPGRRGQATLADGRKTDSSKNIFRVGAHPKEPASVESIVLTKRFSGGADFLLNGLPWRIRTFGGAGYDNLIEPVMNIARWYQIPHCRLQRLVSHPMLNRAHIETRSEHAGGIRGAECLQIELL